MEILHNLASSLLSPMVLAFALGILASLIKSDLKISEEFYGALTIYLLFAIGAPLIVRYGPDTEPALVTLSAPAPSVAAPRCATAPEYGLSCRADDAFLD